MLLLRPVLLRHLHPASRPSLLLLLLALLLALLQAPLLLLLRAQL
jgi:hypothetical protein